MMERAAFPQIRYAEERKNAATAFLEDGKQRMGDEKE